MQYVHVQINIPKIFPEEQQMQNISVTYFKKEISVMELKITITFSANFL